ncbi:MAG TPA: hypothetical protein PLM07_20315, partial [Candidatus Rifleibacterium sp.]|nr:hypothetical protein [Candidatus Rifleibacterium sp.]
NPTTLSGFLAPKAIKPERAYFVAFWGVFKRFSRKQHLLSAGCQKTILTGLQRVKKEVLLARSKTRFPG